MKIKGKAYWAKIPDKHKANLGRETPVKRTVIQTLDMPVFTKVTNRVDVIFNGAEPQVEND